MDSQDSTGEILDIYCQDAKSHASVVCTGVLFIFARKP